MPPLSKVPPGEDLSDAAKRRRLKSAAAPFSPVVIPAVFRTDADSRASLRVNCAIFRRPLTSKHLNSMIPGLAKLTTWAFGQ